MIGAGSVLELLPNALGTGLGRSGGGGGSRVGNALETGFIGACGFR